MSTMWRTRTKAMTERHAPVIEVQTLDLTPELDRAYRLYAAKTIEDRALPDVRDGCKPVQRRILYAMHDMGLRAAQPHKKCARIVGEVLGKYHPHGDQSVYGSLVRMAQPFALREVLVDGQGNFGSIDGDGAAAMRYTEARLSPLGETMLQDIDADTVAFVDNFDTSLTEPSVLPSAFPNLLVNGASGIAVGMATNVPPHNLGEVASAIVHVVRHWSGRAAITTEELMALVPGPDFPTGGIVYRYRDVGGEVVDTIEQAYERGHGRIVTQARMNVEEIGGGKTNIVISELPYNVQTSTVLERIAKEVKDGRITGVTDLRDESDYDKGMRVVVEVSRTARVDKVMADLLKHSQLQETFGCHNLALVPDPVRGGVRPRRLSLREMLVHFIAFRLEVIERRTRHELDRREARLHIVAGLLKALTNIDEVVAIIKKSRTVDTARAGLEKALRLSEIQARAILDMPLRRLTALETGELRDEEKSLRDRIGYLKGLLASEERRLDIVVAETEALRTRHATPRRTVIIDSRQTVAGVQVVTESDLRTPEGRQVILLTTGGIERRDAEGFRYERSDGLTSRATTSQLAQVRADPSDTVLLVSSQGRAWRNQVGFVPGKATFDMLGLGRDERVVSAAVMGGEAAYLVIGTLRGRLKRTRIEDLALTPGMWSRVVGFAEDDDAVLFAVLAAGGAEVVFATAGAQVLRTGGDDVNPQASGTARGVAGIGLKSGDRLVGGAVVAPGDAGNAWVYVVSTTGWVKRVALGDYPLQGRAGQGVRTLSVTRETGDVAAVAFGSESGGLDVLFGNGRRFHVPGGSVPAENRYNRGKRLVDVALAEAPIVGAVVL
jgi:DNA gyrase subunit A